MATGWVPASGCASPVFGVRVETMAKPRAAGTQRGLPGPGARPGLPALLSVGFRQNLNVVPTANSFPEISDVRLVPGAAP